MWGRQARELSLQPRHVHTKGACNPRRPSRLQSASCRLQPPAFPPTSVYVTQPELGTLTPSFVTFGRLPFNFTHRRRWCINAVARTGRPTDVFVASFAALRKFVCVCVCEREKERRKERNKEKRILAINERR